MATTVACIGAGHWGKNLVRNFSQLDVLATICETDPGVRAALAATYPDIRLASHPGEIWSDSAIDAVVIATPAETHGALVRAALLAGKDVLVEKPLCLSPSEAADLIRLAEERERILMVGHLLWYHAGILKLKELVESGELGRLQYIYSNRLNLGKIRREENILWSFAPHDVSVILGIVGELPNSVRAQGGNYLHEAIADVTVSLMSFPSGVRAHVFVSWLHPYKEQKLVVVGDRQMAVFEDGREQAKLQLYPHRIDWRKGMPIPSAAEAVPVPFEHTEPLREECLHFLDCVGHRRRPRTDGHEAMRVLNVLAQCEHSLHKGWERPSPEAETAPNPAARVVVAAHNNGSFVHESSYVDEGAEIGDGTSIWHFSHVLKNTTIGRDCRIGQNVVIGPNVEVGNGVKIQNNVSVYEGVVLEDHVFCGPSMVFTNVINPRSEVVRKNEYRRTLVRRGATLGANCTIVCGTTVGQYAFIGAGTVVTRDVPDFALVVGNPGRIVGWMCMCGHRVKFAGNDGVGACEGCAREYQKVGARVSIRAEHTVLTP